MFEFATALQLSFPNFDPTALQIGPLAIRWYSLAYLSGFLFGWWFLKRQANKPGAVMSKTHADDFLTWIVIGVIAGGRLGYVLFYNFPYYISEPLAIFRLWDGGMSFHGGLIGVILSVVIFSRKYKLNMFSIADLLAVVAPIGLFFGRIANFINGELWGRQTDVPWAMVFPADRTGLPRHPSQLYEALGEGLILFAITFALWRFTNIKRKAPGVIAGFFFLGYGTARFLVEFVREPDSHIGLFSGVSRGQMLSIPMFLFALWLIKQGIDQMNKPQKAQRNTKNPKKKKYKNK